MNTNYLLKENIFLYRFFLRFIDLLFVRFFRFDFSSILRDSRFTLNVF